jgi:hypothetical protein
MHHACTVTLEGSQATVYPDSERGYRTNVPYPGSERGLADQQAAARPPSATISLVL